ncbi:DUF3999 family protein [Sinomicrobium sp.]
MIRIIKICCALYLSFGSFIAYGQMERYDYKRELKGISEQWHEIVIPDELFGRLSDNMNDLRIYGITKTGDTIEAPYLLRSTDGKKSVKKISFKQLNTSRDNKGYYFSFEVPDTETVNRITLDFKQQNFDWQLKLEGSHDQNHWFTVVEDYRILSIRNETVNFKSTNLVFPESKYRYFRVFVNSEERPDLLEASIERFETTKGVFKDYLPQKTEVSVDKTSGQTAIDIDLPLPVPVSRLMVDVADQFDYYRPLTVKYLADSVKTEQGWRYQYHTLTSGTLNSVDNGVFTFNSTVLNRLKVLIDNRDNQPLHIEGVRLSGYKHKLLARFTEPATYYLTYGSTSAMSTNYDIRHFTDRIPENLIPLEVKEEVAIAKTSVEKPSPIFENKMWLWAIMLLIIITLGWFSLKMMKLGNKGPKE